jgi:hypothetical protein
MTPTTRRDPDRMIRSFLEAGPTELSDRVFDAILDDLHRHRQRAGNGLWRIPAMPRSALLAATVIAAVALVAIIIGVTHPFSGVGGKATPTPQPSQSPAANLGEPIGSLVAGTYRTSTFNQPFTAVLPAEPSTLSSAGPAVGDLWTDHKTFRIKLGEASGNAAGAVTIHDDVTLAADLCDGRQGVISDVPASVAAIGTWLTSSSGLTVSAGKPIAVDGRQGMSWDIGLPAGCATHGDAVGPVVGFQTGEHHRVYAIPAGTDTIIAFTWGSGYGGIGEERLSDVNAWADQLIASMRFN